MISLAVRDLTSYDGLWLVPGSSYRDARAARSYARSSGEAGGR